MKKLSSKQKFKISFYTTICLDDGTEVQLGSKDKLRIYFTAILPMFMLGTLGKQK